MPNDKERIFDEENFKTDPIIYKDFAEFEESMYGHLCYGRHPEDWHAFYRMFKMGFQYGKVHGAKEIFNYVKEMLNESELKAKL